MNTLLLILAAFIYQFTDLWKKVIMAKSGGFSARLFINPPFLLLLVFPVIGLLIHLFVLGRFELSKTTIVLGVSTAVFALLLGSLFLGERLNAYNYIGVLAAIAALVLLNTRVK